MSKHDYRTSMSVPGLNFKKDFVKFRSPKISSRILNFLVFLLYIREVMKIWRKSDFSEKAVWDMSKLVLEVRSQSAGLWEDRKAQLPRKRWKVERLFSPLYGAFPAAIKVSPRIATAISNTGQIIRELFWKYLRPECRELTFEVLRKSLERHLERGVSSRWSVVYVSLWYDMQYSFSVVSKHSWL